ncbi:MAG TPA: hypothetical protein VF619_08995 [Allosphingosinicella sp.]|jgi:hypothetical protein
MLIAARAYDADSLHELAIEFLPELASGRGTATRSVVVEGKF